MYILETSALLIMLAQLLVTMYMAHKIAKQP